MSQLYFECRMGAAGDMLMSALYELLPAQKQQEFLTKMNELGIPGLSINATKAQTCGIHGTHMEVFIHGVQEEELMDGHEHEHGHAHSHEHSHSAAQSINRDHAHGHIHSHASYQEMLHHISHLNLPEEVRTHAAAIYRLIGEAEAKAHNSDLDRIHFHEVGTLDALADVVGCCLLIHMLHPEKILCSPIHVGNGTVRCAHGILPVPAPATAEILMGVPIYSGEIQGELCTPTGAAVLKHFAQEFKSMPQLSVTGIGYGIGTRNFPQANCVRTILGDSTDASLTDSILSLTCNLDDITGEALSFACEELLAQGALDVYTTPVSMKKGRPGQLLTCLCRPADEELITALIFRHTTTRGIRVQEHRRHVLTQEFSSKDTPYGSVTMKTSSGYGVTKTKPEYQDLAKLAREHGLSLDEVTK